MKYTFLLPLFALALVSTIRAQDTKTTAAQPAAAPAAAPDPNLKDKISYFIGTQIGSDFKRNGIEVNLDTFGQAVKDALEGKKDSKYTQQELEAAMQQFQASMMAKQQAELEKRQTEMAAAGPKNAEEGTKFLDENGKRAGVTTTASGLQYEVVKAAEGKKPASTDTVTVHYRGTLLSGKEFDSSYSRNEPTSFPLNGVIPGWTEGLQLMPVGSKYKFFIPSKLAYGERGAGADIGPNSTLIFEVELLSIGDKQ
ncbi:MAG: FKBP-type peptidyl-prolyl cis-trans isomerase [Roseimicrobium sp.]